jgi:hypothetical protein
MDEKFKEIEKKLDDMENESLNDFKKYSGKCNILLLIFCLSRKLRDI